MLSDTIHSDSKPSTSSSDNTNSELDPQNHTSYVIICFDKHSGSLTERLQGYVSGVLLAEKLGKPFLVKWQHSGLTSEGPSGQTNQSDLLPWLQFPGHEYHSLTQKIDLSNPQTHVVLKLNEKPLTKQKKWMLQHINFIHLFKNKHVVFYCNQDIGTLLEQNPYLKAELKADFKSDQHLKIVKQLSTNRNHRGLEILPFSYVQMVQQVYGTLFTQHWKMNPSSLISLTNQYNPNHPFKFQAENLPQNSIVKPILNDEQCAAKIKQFHLKTVPVDNVGIQIRTGISSHRHQKIKNVSRILNQLVHQLREKKWDEKPLYVTSDHPSVLIELQKLLPHTDIYSTPDCHLSLSNPTIQPHQILLQLRDFYQLSQSPLLIVSDFSNFGRMAALCGVHSVNNSHSHQKSVSTVLKMNPKNGRLVQLSSLSAFLENPLKSRKKKPHRF